MGQDRREQPGKLAPRDQARHHLEVWGRWWRRREEAECSTSTGASPASVLRETLILGTRVQKTNTHAHRTLSDAIRPPPDIVLVGTLVDRLPDLQRAEIVGRYLRRVIRGPRTPACVRAELAIGKWLTEEHVDEAFR